MRIRPAVACLLLLSPAVFAQSAIVGAGHWEGALKIPNRAMKVAVDLARSANGEWIGDFDLPDQGIKDMPLANIRIEGNMVRFELGGIPGNPSFEGEVSPYGDAMAGDFAVGGGTLGCELRWISEPKVSVPKKSSPVAKEFEGVWEGTLTNPNGERMRVIIRLQNNAAGATGTIMAPEQGPQPIPLAGIVQEGSRLRFEVSLFGASYAGELRGDYLTGAWSYGNAEMPLRLSRPQGK